MIVVVVVVDGVVVGTDTLISENGLQFDSKSFRRYCCELGIKNRYSTPAYPQGNR